MSARDDYPNLAAMESDRENWAVASQYTRALDEIDRLRAEYRRLRLAAAMETDAEAEAHAAAVPEFT